MAVSIRYSADAGCEWGLSRGRHNRGIGTPPCSRSVRERRNADHRRILLFRVRISRRLQMTESETPEWQLVTVRDWLRYAVSRFNQAELIYGHGTATALDEAAFLILHTLHLPIDQLDPWLDARLLPAERLALKDIVDRRISARKPAAYLTREAWIGSCSFYIDERVIVPRSYIGELLGDGLAGMVPDGTTVRRIGPVHRLRLPRHSRRVGIPRSEGRRQRYFRRGACRRLPQYLRLRLRGSHFVDPVRPLREARQAEIRP